MQLHLNNGHQVPSIPYKWQEHRFLMAEGWNVAYEMQCKCILISLVVKNLLDVQSQFTETSFIIEICYLCIMLINNM